MPEDQSEVIAFLADPATHGGAAVTRIDTHSAHVFLAGERAWKIKRAVRYDYLDFSTLAKRKAVLDRELALNAPAAPMLYRRVVAITREPGGRLALGGTGAPVEHALEMRRFPEEAQLDRVAAAGGLDDARARDLGAAVAAHHAAAERRDADGAELIAEILAELGRVFAGMERELGRAAIARFRDRAEAALLARAALLSRRSAEGRVRRCHADLHLANIVLIDGRPVLFDALEFDERLGTCDVVYDLAFLLMDLCHRGLDRAANLVLNAWLAHTEDDAGLALLPLCLGVRAAIRAMVTVQTARATGAPVPDEARRYLDEAARALDPPPPRLVALGGLSGTGKTTLARALAPGLPPAPGAVHLRTDEIRKALHGVAPLDPLPAESYRAEISAQVYARMFERAQTCLAAGQSVLLDATFLNPAEREALAALADAAQCPLAALWLDAPAEVLLARVAARAPDASDADAAVVRAQIARARPPADWPRIDTAGTPEATLAALRDALAD